MSLQFGLKYIRELAPYQAGKSIAEVAREFNLHEDKIIKLASNENPLGMSDLTKQAVQNAITNIHRYPDTNGLALKTTICAKYNIPLDWITLGNGSNEILELVAHAFVRPKQSIIYAQYSFLIYALITQAIGARSIEVAAQNFGHNLPAMVQSITEDTRLIYIANPNNPTGTFLSSIELEIFLKAILPHIIVVIDEAYNEYLSIDLHYNSINLIHTYSNLIILRTMSKAYGLAGLRIGFAIAQPDVTDLLNRIRQPFNVNLLGQVGAIAALNDSIFLQRSIEINILGYKQLTQAFDEIGLKYIPSFANFILVKVGDDNNAGARINLALLKRGIIVRQVNNYGLLKWLRITIGLPEENAAFIFALRAILGNKS